MRKRWMAGAALAALVAGSGTLLAQVGGKITPSVAPAPPQAVHRAKPKPKAKAKAVAQRAWSAGWAGTYRGPFDGGRGIVTITADDETPDYQVKLVTLGEGGCSGEVSTMSAPEGNRMELNIFTGDDPPVCKITLVRQGGTLRVSESGCLSQHGMSCAFSGSATKTR